MPSRSLLLVCTLFALLTRGAVIAATYYVAPNALGTGSGTSAANAADYLSGSFWGTVQSSLSGGAGTVYFTSGSYNRGTLNLYNMGNAANKLSLVGQTDTGAIFNSSSSGFLLDLRGSRNVLVQDLNFNGSGPDHYALMLKSDTNACQTIEINSCTFTNLTNVQFGGIAVQDFATTGISVVGCTFDRLGRDRLAHAIYVAHGPQNLTIQNNTFTDIAGLHVKFRDCVSNVTVADNTFSSTATYQPEIDGSTSPRGLIFIGIENYNNEARDNEMFGSNYDIHGNSFRFPNLGTARDAIIWYHSGFETGGLDQILSAADAATLQDGAPFYKRGVLNRAGVITTGITIYGNTYNNYVKRRAVYGWSYAGNSGTESITNAVTYTDVWSYDYEGQTGDPAGWNVTQYPPNTDVYVTTASAGRGSSSVRLTDSSTTLNCNIKKNISSPVANGYYRTYFYVSSHNNDLFPILTNATPIYWIKAKNNGTWGNNTATFSGSWTTGTWYLLELEFHFGANSNYTVWVNNTKVASAIAIPTTNTSMSGDLTISPATISATGNMLIDYNKLATYEP